MKKVFWIIFAGLCIVFSTYPISYFLADQPIRLLLSKSAELLANRLYMLCFYLHISFGGIALLIGWLQFSKKLRRKNLKLHRLIGKIYISAVLISGIPGFYIALFASGGLSPQLGFSIGAVLWVVITTLGLTSIKKGQVEAHKQWMMYSYAGTFGAVTLRLWLPVLIAIFGGFTPAYQVVAWLSWLPNLLIVYFVLQRQKQKALSVATY